MRWIIIALQVCILTLFALLGNEVAKLLHIPLPGSIIGMVLLFVGLKTKVIKLDWVEKGGNFLLGEMLMFFIPSVVGVVKYADIVKVDGIQFLLVILGSTLLVMATTGAVAELMARKRSVAK